MESTCPFCSLPPDRVLLANEHAMVIRDGFPVSPGHTLVIPRRHVGSFFDATAAEQVSLLALLDTAKRQLDIEFAPLATTSASMTALLPARPFRTCIST